MKNIILAQAGFNIASAELAKIIKSVGFDGVFLSQNQDNITAADVAAYRKEGLLVETFHLPYNKPFKLINALWSNNGDAPTALNILKQDIDFACSQNIPTVILHASSGKNPPPVSQQGLDNFLKLAEHCEKTDTVLAIENIKRYDYVAYLLEHCPSPKVKFCFDLGHANAFTQNLYCDDWALFFDRLHCLHIHDNDGQNDLHLMPGMGNIRFKEILPKLSACNPHLNTTLELYYVDREQYYTFDSAREFYTKAFLSLKNL